MKALTVKSDIHWVGARDWAVRDFHGYKTSRGSSYNSYLIMDEKITLVDTVKATHVNDLMDRIESIVDPSKIEYIVINHVELDHTGGLPDMMKIAPNATILTSTNGEKGLRAHFDAESWNIQVVKSGEAVSIGKRTLNFVHTPMLHWPDSMVTYVPEDKLLFSNDAFGQHIASEYLFDDECGLSVLLEEGAKYYANILYPFGAACQKALKALGGLDIDMIAPSHGVIWRSHSEQIIAKYDLWSSGKDNGKAVVIYDTMWGSTEKIAREIASAFEDHEIPVSIRSLKANHISEIIPDLLEARYVAIGSAVLNGSVMPTVAAYMNYMKGLKPANKMGFAFGSYGWSDSATKEIKQNMSDLGWTLLDDHLGTKYKTGNVKDEVKTRINTMVAH
ncbi:MAG: FprA family A-type flavoprotein [Bacteriovoracaceae bacterium]|nr:FprA family A-type flavoprotein [Bacteriovoracaceae bacterium]